MHHLWTHYGADHCMDPGVLHLYAIDSSAHDMLCAHILGAGMDPYWTHLGYLARRHGLRSWDLGLGTWDLDPGPRDLDLGSGDPGIWDLEILGSMVWMPRYQGHRVTQHMNALRITYICFAKACTLRLYPCSCMQQAVWQCMRAAYEE